MINLNKNSKITLLSISFVLGLMGPVNVLAATSPNLGAAASYSVLSGAAATNAGAGQTTISGNFGVFPNAFYNDTAANLTIFQTAGNPHLANVPAQNAQSAQLAVFNGPVGIDAVSQPCTNVNLPTWDLTGLILNPGVYCTDVDFLLSGTLTLRGTGSPATDVWIFRAGRDFIGSGTANIVFSGTGGLPCNVWWRLVRDATFTANNAMIGNILAANSITFGQSATLDGRAFAYTSAVTLLGNNISGPTCTVPPPPPVITGSGGVYSVPWVTPLITVIKVPTPLALPLGPGSVAYNYTVLNPGTIPMTNIIVTDNKCSPVSFISGDTNNDSKLDVNESWKYGCTATLTQTTTNTVTATGRSINGLTATDTANATVIVSIPVPIVLGVSTTTVSYPSLPNAGIVSDEKNTSWNTVAILFGFFALSVLSIKSLKREVSLIK